MTQEELENEDSAVYNFNLAIMGKEAELRNEANRHQENQAERDARAK